MPASASLPRPLLGWRFLSLLYDFFPALGLWFLTSVVALAFNHGETVRPGSVAAWLEALALFAVTGLYATASWRRGGQTIGMKPWRLYVEATDGGRPCWRALWLRYLCGCVSLLALGAGFWWAWIDRDRLTFHDRMSGTRFVRDRERDRPSRER